MNKPRKIPNATEAMLSVQKKLSPINSKKKRKTLNTNVIFILLILIGIILTAMTFNTVKLKPNSRTEDVKIIKYHYDQNNYNKPFTTPIEIKIPPLNTVEYIQTSLGNDVINIKQNSLIKYDLPNVYHENLDFSSFQPYMCYTAITNETSSAWKIVNSKNAYTDDNGFRRYYQDKNTFTINNKPDYIIALGTYYKQKGICGTRYLIVTENGMYTAITGDEKSDAHTDKNRMFTTHGNRAGVIEWIVDQDSNKLSSSITRMGTVTAGSIKEFTGKILYIYKIK